MPMLCLTNLPDLFTALQSYNSFLMILRPALFAEVFSRQFVFILGQSHANVMLPCRAFVAADHSPLVIRIFFDISTNASNDSLWLFFLFWFLLFL